VADLEGGTDADAIQKDVISDLTKEFTVDGPTLTNSSGVKKRYSPIPVLENQVLEMTNQQKIREGMVESGSMTEAEANVHATRLILEKTAREPSKDEAGRPSTAPAHLDISPPAPSTA
jgi:hypothetical protein